MGNEAHVTARFKALAASGFRRSASSPAVARRLDAEDRPGRRAGHVTSRTRSVYPQAAATDARVVHG